MKVIMAETSNEKIIEVRKSSTTKFMAAFAANTLREMVKAVNEKGIKREDIVSLLKDNSQFWLIYYK